MKANPRSGRADLAVKPYCVCLDKSAHGWDRQLHGAGSITANLDRLPPQVDPRTVAPACLSCPGQIRPPMAIMKEA